MFLGFLVLLTALSISAVAIYYSVAGLVAIFASAAVPIMIMGGVLEVGKLVTAVWLHRYWREAAWWLKSYLVLAVIVLMFITSMGIFGFLSRAHIEQTANAQEGIAQIERIETEIERQTAITERAKQEILSIQTAGAQTDNTIQEQIDREQQRIDTAYARIQPAIDEQLSVIQREEAAVTQRAETFQLQLDQINLKLSELTDALNAGDIRRAQGIVGARQDGSLGPNTSAAIQSFRDSEEAKRNELLNRIESIRTAPNSIISDAREEIARLRSTAETQIEQSNTLINRLRDQLGVIDVQSINQNIATQETIIADSSAVIDTLTEQKYTLQTEYRKLEAEVGPIKYIAEFVYGEQTDQNTLEEAVRWVIILIIFVFDPLAVLLLIASQYTIEHHRKLRKEQNNSKVELKETSSDTGRIESDAASLLDRTDDNGRDDSDELVVARQEVTDDLEQDQLQADILVKEIAESFIEQKPDEPTVDDTESLDNLTVREQEYKIKEQSEIFRDSKNKWKDDHPNETLKVYKAAYIEGKIDKLPWEGYNQNEEQNDTSLFNKIRSNDRKN